MNYAVTVLCVELETLKINLAAAQDVERYGSILLRIGEVDQAIRDLLSA